MHLPQPRTSVIKCWWSLADVNALPRPKLFMVTAGCPAKSLREVVQTATLRLDDATKRAMQMVVGNAGP